jgi:branched-chain amino acid transport system ATP-binding protein
MAEGATPLLEVEDLEAGYGPVQVLRGMSFSVAVGEVVVILGANGAGKTTTIRAICGMIPTKGTVSIDGKAVGGKSPDEVVRLGLAHVPQGRGTFVDLTVEENLRLGAFIRKDDDIAADMERWYEVFPRLKERRDQVAGGMSGGEQQMLAIARAAMSRPRLLLLDEPSLGLAPLVTQELFRQLQSLNQEAGTALLVVEQNANLALGIAERGYVLEAGTIVAEGSADQLKADESVRKAYLGI